MGRKVEVIVGLTDKTKSGAQSAIGNIGGIGKAAAALGAGAAVGVGALAAGVTKLASDAEPLVGVQRAFEGVTAEFEGGSASMLKALQEAGNGMVKNTDLMETFNKAAQLVSVDFAQQLPDAMQYLGKVAAATGQDMGYLLDSLTTGVGRMSAPILDNLAIQVDATKANEDYAESIGKAADELTKGEQQTALMNQVLEKLAENTANMPDISAPFARLRTTIGNLADNAMQRLFVALEPLANQLADLAETVIPVLVNIVTLLFSGMQTGIPAIDNLVASISAFIAKAQEALAPVIAFVQKHVEMQDVLAAVAVVAASVLIPAIIGIITTIAPIIAVFAAVVAAAALLRKAWETNFGGIQEKTQTVWKAVQQVIEFAIENIKLVIQAFNQLIAGDWEALGQTLLEIWNNTLTAIVAILTGLWDMIKPVLVGLWNSIKTWFTSTDWKSLGLSIIQGILNGLDALGGQIRAKLVGFAQDAWDAVKDFFDIGSPSRLMQGLGEDVVAGFVKGLSDTSAVVNASIGMASAALAPVSATPGLVASTVNNANVGGDSYHFYGLNERGLYGAMNNARNANRARVREFTQR